jgi:hypothetical protein
MEAQAWTAAAFLATALLWTLFRLGTRIDSLGGRIDALGGRLDGRIDGLEGRFAEFQERADPRFDALTSEVRAQSARIEQLSLRLDDHLRRHAS